MRYLIISLELLFAFSVPASAATKAFLGDSSGLGGTAISVPLEFATDQEIVGVQFDVRAEAGSATVSGVTAGLDFSFTDHRIETEALASGALRVLIASRSTSGLYPGNLARIAVDLSADVPANDRSVALSNVVFATREGAKAAIEVVPHLLVTSPARGFHSATGAEVQIGVESADTIEGGLVTQVEFFADGTSIGIDDTAPYTAAWTPAAPGNYAITAIATSNSGTTRTSRSLPVHIGVGSAFEGWQLDNFDAVQLADANISGAGANPDGDRLSNAGEFAFGGIPLSFDSSPTAVEILTDPTNGNQHLSFTYWRSIFATDVPVAIQQSSSLSDWQPAAASVVELLVVPYGDFEQVTVFDNIPIGSGMPREMLRARIELP